MKTLVIRLTAPLQSYGNEATFNRRTSNYYPSKSAVIGMIAAALGYRRDDSRINDLNNLKLAVRIDQPGKFMTDFQVVEYQKNSSSKTKKVTYRSYLQDAVFTVAIGSDDEKIIRIKTALEHPKFQLFLGRRSNPPAGPLIMKEYDDDPMTVLKQLPWKASRWYQKRLKSKPYYFAEIIADADLVPDQPNFLVKDKVTSFDQKNRSHGYRAVVRERQKVLNPYADSTEHDAFKAVKEES